MEAFQLDKPAPASAALRATKDQRFRYLEQWCDLHPLETIEAARSALKQEFTGVAMGTKVISDTLSAARRRWDEKVKTQQAQQAALVVTGDQPIQKQIASWAQGMRIAGVRLIEILDDGKVRVEFSA